MHLPRRVPHRRRLSSLYQETAAGCDAAHTSLQLSLTKRGEGQDSADAYLY